jgi:hypothetical protein
VSEQYTVRKNNWLSFRNQQTVLFLFCLISVSEQLNKNRQHVGRELNYWSLVMLLVEQTQANRTDIDIEKFATWYNSVS